MKFLEFIIKLCQVFVNDKILVILAVTAIAVLCILRIPEKAETIVTAAFTGLFGIAVGMGMRRAGDVLQNGDSQKGVVKK